VRCFIAIDIGEGVRKEIESIVGELRKFKADVRWIRVKSIHLTLKFLGETDEKNLPHIQERLTAIASQHGDFTVGVMGTGVFPDYSRPRVIWVGIEDREELQQLYSEVDDHMGSLGYKPERRRFRPHLTIGRIKSRPDLAPVLQGLRDFGTREFGSIDIGEILLMKSTLKPSGAEYQVLFSAQMGKEV
jgi:2'-5' RNA ligase